MNREPEPPRFLEPVRASIRSPLAATSRTPAPADPTDGSPAPGGPLAARVLAPVLGIGALAVAWSTVAVVAVLGGFAMLALTLHRVARRVRFGFGDGFLAFRSDATWPRGVQEDDDFHWSWSAADPAAAARRQPAGR